MAIFKSSLCVKLNDNRQGVRTFFNGQYLCQISYIEEFLQKKALKMFVGSSDWYGIYIYVYGVYLYLWVRLPPVQKNCYKTREGKILHCCMTWSNSNYFNKSHS